MSNRVSQIVLLCEDQQHHRFVIAFLKQCGIRNPDRMVRALVASQLMQGGNVGWVLEKFPQELRRYRKRQKKAKSLLVVMVDADNGTVEDRRSEFADRAKSSGLTPHEEKESVVLLIPKRHVETWILCLLGNTVTEEEDCKTRKRPTKVELREASIKLYEWSRPNAQPDATGVVPSLLRAIPEWNKIANCLG
jgi:hypothetical protein